MKFVLIIDDVKEIEFYDDAEQMLKKLYQHIACGGRTPNLLLVAEDALGIVLDIEKKEE